MEEFKSMKDMPINFTQYKKGDIISGTIVMFSKRGAIINVGGMKDGIAQLEQDAHYSIGDTVLALVTGQIDDMGCIVLDVKNASKIVEEKEKLADIKVGSIIEFFVKNIGTAGLGGEYYGYHVFLPYSHISPEDYALRHNFNNKKFEAVVLELNSYKKSIVCSSKILHAQNMDNSKVEMKVGDVIKGTCLKVFDKYAIVMLTNGVKAKIDIYNVSYDNIKSVSEVLSEAKQYDFVVLETNEDHSKNLLGYKQLKPNPYDELRKNLKVGDELSGEIIKIFPSGALIKFDNGLTALALNKDHSDNPRIATHHLFKLASRVDATISYIDETTGKMNAIVKQ